MKKRKRVGGSLIATIDRSARLVRVEAIMLKSLAILSFLPRSKREPVEETTPHTQQANAKDLRTESKADRLASSREKAITTISIMIGMNISTNSSCLGFLGGILPLCMSPILHFGYPAYLRLFLHSLLHLCSYFSLHPHFQPHFRLNFHLGVQH